ncbi:MAG: hypothetical protein AABW58_01570 [Nanoarchaeota archaeon]
MNFRIFQIKTLDKDFDEELYVAPNAEMAESAYRRHFSGLGPEVRLDVRHVGNLDFDASDSLTRKICELLVVGKIDPFRINLPDKETIKNNLYKEAKRTLEEIGEYLALGTRVKRKDEPSFLTFPWEVYVFVNRTDSLLLGEVCYTATGPEIEPLDEKNTKYAKVWKWIKKRGLLGQSPKASGRITKKEVLELLVQNVGEF